MKEKTKTWFELAGNDLAFARSIIENGNRPYFPAHYCHRAIEKILKAIFPLLRSGAFETDRGGFSVVKNPDHIGKIVKSYVRLLSQEGISAEREEYYLG